MLCECTLCVVNVFFILLFVCMFVCIFFLCATILVNKDVYIGAGILEEGCPYIQILDFCPELVCLGAYYAMFSVGIRLICVYCEFE